MIGNEMASLMFNLPRTSTKRRPDSHCRHVIRCKHSIGNFVSMFCQLEGNFNTNTHVYLL